MKPIARRIYYGVVLLCAFIILLFNVATRYMQESLEGTMLDIEFQQEDELFFERLDFSKSQLYSSSENYLAFEKDNEPLDALPGFLRALPANYRGEIEVAGITYLVTRKDVAGGEFFLAKNITHFEDQEALFNMAMLVISAVSMLLSLFLARFLSRRLAQPLEKLSDDISATQTGVQMRRLDTNYQDLELHLISQNFNLFLEQIEQFVQREKNLINMAGHELRTPIAVTLGGLEVLEKRGNLSEKDMVTVHRIRSAANIMRTNLDVLLSLARHEQNAVEEQHELVLTEILQSVEDDLLTEYSEEAERLQIDVYEIPTLFMQPNLAYMLLKNLIQNALQHTQGKVVVRLYKHYLELKDEGSGLSAVHIQRLQKNMETVPNNMGGGLGLYIVTLMAERLNWRIEVCESGANGTTIRVHLNSTA